MENLAEDILSSPTVEEYSEKGFGVGIESSDNTLADSVDILELKKEYIRYIDRLLQKGGPSEEDYPNLDAWIIGIDQMIKAGYIGPRDIASLRARFGDVFSLQTLAGFAFLKPHGYAGDYQIIDRIYQAYISPVSHLSKWDRYAQRLAASQAVRNRKTYFQELLRSHCASRQGRALHVLNIASGPGRDMFEYLSTNGSSEVYFDCIEQDQEAINYASLLCSAFLDRITFIRSDVLRFRPCRKYDIIWSAGLFDYFNDKVFKAVLKRLVPAVAPGGEIVIGNFSHANPSRCWMELCGWILHHRSPAELLLLAEECGIPRSNLTIGQEPQGVNLFLHITYPERTVVQTGQYLTRGSSDVENIRAKEEEYTISS